MKFPDNSRWKYFVMAPRRFNDKKERREGRKEKSENKKGIRKRKKERKTVRATKRVEEEIRHLQRGESFRATNSLHLLLAGPPHCS